MVDQKKNQEIKQNREQYIQLLIFYLILAFLDYELSHQYFWIIVIVSP